MSTSIAVPSGGRTSSEQRRLVKDLSPEPIQTFHKDKISGPHLTGTHLFEGVTGAAHVHSSSTATEEQHVLGSPKARHRHSSSMSNPLEHEVVLEGKRKQVLDDVLALFSSKPSVEIFERSWRPDAIFEDPLSKCFGYKEYAPQWFGLEKLFPTSITKSYRVLSSTHNPNRIIYHQEQEYTMRGLGTKKLMVSTIEIDLDEHDMITHLQDKWNGKEQPTNFIAMALRRLNARTVPWFVSVPSLKKEH